MACRHVLLLLVVLVAVYAMAEGRYLPTRSMDDRVDRLRDLIRDLLESEVEKYNGNDNLERALLYKRQIPGRAVLTEDMQEK